MGDHARWYEGVTTNSLEQGDLFFDFPVVVPSITADDIRLITSGMTLEKSAEVTQMDVVVMTQSCDLENNKTKTIILCPIWELDEMQYGKDKKEQIRKGYQPSFHLLNQDNALGIPYTLVEFSRLYMTAKDALSQFAGSVNNRPRLISPYKEHLSQAFARYFMRVGLPSGIPHF